MKTLWGTAAASLLLLAAFWGGRVTKPCRTPVVRVDTVVVRDTIRDTVPVPKISRIMRTDTVFVKVAGDTVWINAEVPVEQKVYRTDDYRAVVEGFRPSLVEMELYRNTIHINRETTITPPRSRPRRWGIGVHAGYGVTTKGAAPYIGAGVQYNIIVW